MLQSDLRQLHGNEGQSAEPVSQPGPQGRTTGRGCKEIRSSQVTGYVPSDTVVCICTHCTSPRL